MKKRVLAILLVMSMVSVTACGAKKQDTNKKSEEKVRVIKQADIEEATETVDESAQSEEQDITPAADIALTNTYTTRYEEVNMVTYPNFTFSYPDGWNVTEQDVTAQQEVGTISNDRGVTVTFMHIDGTPGGLGAGSSVSAARVEVSKVGDSQFIPGYVQDANYADLGTFGVMKLKQTGQIDMKSGTGEVEDIDGSTAYGVLPESRIGTDDMVNSLYCSEFSFYYSAYISLIAQSPDGTFTPEEEQQVIAILGSFKVVE